MKEQSSTQPWYERAVVYQIYPWSWKDSNGDGVGDLEGIISKLDYLAGKPDSLGVNAIWLSPIFTSPMKDFGYDIADYYTIDPHFGSLATFARLVSEAHRRGIKIILDLVTNHTSSEHPWFIESKNSRTNSKRDWYIWRDPTEDGGVPNNWLSVPGSSAWTLDPMTEQYYLHQFLPEQPDLNWRNPEVRAEFKRIMEFWIGRGVDGFRVDAISHMIEDKEFRDEPKRTVQGKVAGYNKLIHIYSKDQPELAEVIGLFSEIAHAHKDIFIVTETYSSLDGIVSFYKAGKYHNQAPFNFGLIDLPWDAEAYRAVIDVYERAVDRLDTRPYVLGNHDIPRLASRIGRENTPLAAMLLLTLPGTPFIYYGEELGMKSVDIPKDKVRDGFVSAGGTHRDGSRTPMQWLSGPHAGFSTAEPWLPLSPDADKINVEVEQTSPRSLLQLYKKLIQLRMGHSILRIGKYKSRATRSPDVLAYTRTEGKESLLIMLNFSDQIVSEALASGGTILQSTYMDSKTVITPEKVLTLRPQEGVIIRI